MIDGTLNVNKRFDGPLAPDVMDKDPAVDLPPWLVHPDTLSEDFSLAHRIAHYKRPRVNKNAQLSESVADLINQGHRLLHQLDNCHNNLHDAIETALDPDPQAWKRVKTEAANYTAIYAEISQLSKRLNQLINSECRELLLEPLPVDTGVHGLLNSQGEEVDV